MPEFVVYSGDYVRRDADGVVRRYAHLGTGNYNPVTARFYTDISILTSRIELTGAVQKVFNHLTADTESVNYDPLLVAPITLADKLIALIERETEHAKQGRPAVIVAKMNGLIDQRTIEIEGQQRGAGETSSRLQAISLGSSSSAIVPATWMGSSFWPYSSASSR